MAITVNGVTPRQGTEATLKEVWEEAARKKEHDRVERTWAIMIAKHMLSVAIDSYEDSCLEYPVKAAYDFSQVEGDDQVIKTALRYLNDPEVVEEVFAEKKL